MSLHRDSCFMPQPTSPHHPGSSQPVILLRFKRIIPRRTSTPQEQLAKHSVYGRLIVGGGVEVDSGADQTQVKSKRPDQLQLHARWECFLSRPEFPISTFSFLKSFLCVCLQSVFMAGISCSVKILCVRFAFLFPPLLIPSSLAEHQFTATLAICWLHVGVPPAVSSQGWHRRRRRRRRLRLKCKQ